MNAPVSVLSFGSNDGNVDQSNEGNTTASSKNDNSTEQGNLQFQKASTSGNGGGQDGGQGDASWNGGSGKGGSIHQSQSAENSNESEQTADSSAESERKNINKPFSLVSFGSNDGNVHQASSLAARLLRRLPVAATLERV